MNWEPDLTKLAIGKTIRCRNLITRYYIFPNVCLCPGQNQWNWVKGHWVQAMEVASFDLKCLRPFYTTRQQVPYKCRNICRNGSVITCNFEHENVGQHNGKQLSHFRCQISKHVKDVSHNFVLALIEILIWNLLHWRWSMS